MLPPGDYQAAYERLSTALAAGAEDPEAINDATDVPLSQFVRIGKVLEALPDNAAVLAHFAVAPAQWERARRAWLPLLHVLELTVRYHYWHGRIDVTNDVAAVRRASGR